MLKEIHDLKNTFLMWWQRVNSFKPNFQVPSLLQLQKSDFIWAGNVPTYTAHLSLP